MFRKKRREQSFVEELSKVRNPQKKSVLLRTFLLESRVNIVPQRSREQNCYNYCQDRRSKSNFKARKKSHDSVKVLLEIDRKKAAQSKNKMTGLKAKSIDPKDTTRKVSKEQMLTKDWDCWKNELLEKHLKGMRNFKEGSLEAQYWKGPSSTTSEESMTDQLKRIKQSRMTSELQENVNTSRSQSKRSRIHRSQSSRRVEVSLKKKINNNSRRDEQSKPGLTETRSQVNNDKNIYTDTCGKISDKGIKKFEYHGHMVDDIKPNRVNNRDTSKPNPNHCREGPKPINIKIRPGEAPGFMKKKERYKQIPVYSTKEAKSNSNNTKPKPVPSAQETSSYNPDIGYGVSERDKSRTSRSKHVRNVISVNQLVKLDQSVLSHIDKNRDIEKYARHLKDKWGQSVPFRENYPPGTEMADTQNTTRGGNAVEYLYFCDEDMKTSRNRTPKSKVRAKKCTDPIRPILENLKSLRSELEEDYHCLQNTQTVPDRPDTYESTIQHRQQYPIDAEFQSKLYQDQCYNDLSGRENTNISNQQDASDQAYIYPLQPRTLQFKQGSQTLNRCEPTYNYPLNATYLRPPDLESLKTYSRAGKSREFEPKQILTPQISREFDAKDIHSSLIPHKPPSRILSANTNRSTRSSRHSSVKRRSQSPDSYEGEKPASKASYRGVSIISQNSYAQVSTRSGRTKSIGSRAYLPLEQQSRYSFNPAQEQGLISHSQRDLGKSFHQSTRSNYLMGLQTSVYATQEDRPQSSTGFSQEKKLSPHLEQLIEHVKNISQQYYKLSSRTMIPVLRQVQNTFICRFCNLRQYLHTYVENFERNAQQYVDTYEARKARRSATPARRADNWGEKSYYPCCLPCGCRIMSSRRTTCCCNMCCNRCTCNMCMCYYNRNRT